MNILKTVTTLLLLFLNLSMLSGQLTFEVLQKAAAEMSPDEVFVFIPFKDQEVSTYDYRVFTNMKRKKKQQKFYQKYRHFDIHPTYEPCPNDCFSKGIYLMDIEKFNQSDINDYAKIAHENFKALQTNDNLSEKERVALSTSFNIHAFVLRDKHFQLKREARANGGKHQIPSKDHVLFAAANWGRFYKAERDNISIHYKRLMESADKTISSDEQFKQLPPYYQSSYLVQKFFLGGMTDNLEMQYEALSDLILIVPEESYYFIKLAEVAEQLARQSPKYKKETEQLYERLINDEALSKRLDLQMNYAKYQIFQKEIGLGIRICDKIIKNHELNLYTGTEPHYLKGWAYIFLKRPKSAIESIEQLLNNREKLSPNPDYSGQSGKEYLILAYANYQLGKEDQFYDYLSKSAKAGCKEADEFITKHNVKVTSSILAELNKPTTTDYNGRNEVSWKEIQRNIGKE